MNLKLGFVSLKFVGAIVNVGKSCKSTNFKSGYVMKLSVESRETCFFMAFVDVGLLILS